MKLTKEQFVENVDNLISMHKKIYEITSCFEVSECVFDNWFDSYYTLVDKLCEIPDHMYDNWFGTPLDYWIFTAGGEYIPTPYTDVNKEKVYFHSTEEVYDYIISSTT